MTEQSTPAQTQPPIRFLVTLEARATFLSDATPPEKQSMQQHAAYLRSMFASGKMIWGGRYADAPFAVIVLQAASLQEAERWVGEDPGVRDGILAPRIHPFLMFFDRTRTPET